LKSNNPPQVSIKTKAKANKLFRPFSFIAYSKSCYTDTIKINGKELLNNLDNLCKFIALNFIFILMRKQLVISSKSQNYIC